MRGGIAFLVLLAAAFVAGCGGDGDGDRLTAEEFRQQADATCVEFEGRLEELGMPESLEDLQGFVDDAVPILEEGTNELEQLQPPEELEEDWNRAMEINREQLDTVRELRTAAEEGDQARIAELLQEANAARQESDQLAADLGLEQCGSEASVP
jgi:hypothetical protein